MRVPRNRVVHGKQRLKAFRRTALLSVILASTPALAEEEKKSSIRLNPMVPAQTQPIKNNPFVKSAPDTTNPDIKLASNQDGKATSIVKLKPIGKVIDLNPIGSGPARLGPKIEIEKPKGRVQANPLIGMPEYNEVDVIDVGANEPMDRLLDDAAANVTAPAPVMKVPHAPVISLPVPPMPASAPAEETQLERAPMFPVPPTSPALAVPSTPVKMTAPTAAAPLAEIPPAVAHPVPVQTHNEPQAMLPVAPTATQDVPAMIPLVQIDSSSAQETVATPISQQQAPLGITIVDSSVKPASDARDNKTAIVESNPIFFSLTDEDPTEPSTSNVERTKPAGKSGGVVLVPAPEFNPGNSKPAVELSISGKSLSIPPVRESNQLPLPLNSVNGAKAMPLSGASMEDAAISSRQRYRPPVAVAAPPLLIERGSKNLESVESTEMAKSPVMVAPPVSTIIPAPVFQNEAKNPVAQHQPVAQKKVTTPKLRMTRAQVRSLTLGGQVRRVSVADQGVCQAFASGPNQLKLIGVGNGVTRLVVWAAPNNGTRLIRRAFDIQVDEAVETSVGAIGNKVAVLNRSIRNTFPNARIQVKRLPDHLIVGGYCNDEDTAKKIVRMVRKTCLVPVRDEIKIR